MTVIILAVVLIASFLLDYQSIWPSAPTRSHVFYLCCMGIASVFLYISAMELDFASPLEPVTEFFARISSQ